MAFGYTSEQIQAFGIGGKANRLVGLVLASAATVTPLFEIHHISGTTQITTIVVPWDGFAGTICFIPDGVFTLATGGNIAIAATAVVNKAMYLTFDPVAGLWYPSYLA